MAALFGRHERSYECPLIGGIALQNSQNAGRLLFRGKKKQATIADQCSLKPATGIACEFGARRRSPPHNYSIVAPTARRIRVPCRKKTFATLSPYELTSSARAATSEKCQEACAQRLLW